MRDAPVVVRVRRGTSVESEHRGAWCFVGPEGVFSSGGDQTRRRFLRSAAKPFQAVAALERILAAGFDLDDDEIAVLAASTRVNPFMWGPSKNFSIAPVCPVRRSAAGRMRRGTARPPRR